MLELVRSGRVALAMFFGAGLAACGGGGRGSDTPPPVTASAVADSGFAPANRSVVLSVLANDKASDGVRLTLSATTPAAHGQVAIQGDTLVYTPAPGYIGADSFSYTVQAGSATATAQVTLKVRAELTLQGVIAEALPGAAITVSVGPTVLNTTADASGNFSIPITSEAAGDMIGVQAQGAGGMAYIKLLSLVGDVQSALAAAGTAATAGPAQLPGLRVSSLSTAVAVIARQNNGGVTPATQQALDDAVSTIRVLRLTDMTNVLRGLAGATVDGSRLALPAGAGDTLAAVSDGALYKQLASAYLGSAPLRVLPEDYRYHSESADSVAVGSITIFHSNNNCCGYAAQELVRNQDGSGSWFDGQARHAGTWDQDGVFKLTTPRIRAEQRLRNNRYEVLEVALEQVRVRRQWGNARLGFATITEIGHEYQNGAVVPDSFYSGSFGFTYNNWTLLSAPGNISGAVVAGLPQLSATVTLSSQVVMQFNADGSASTLADRGRSAVAHTWKFQDGKLVLDNGTGMTAELVKSSGSNSGEHWLARIHDNGVVRPYSLGVFRNVKAGLAFTDSSALGRWESASSIIGFGPHDVVDVLANYISADVTVPYTPVPTAWWVSNGVLVMTSQDPREYRGYPDCQEGFICAMFKERAWTLLAQEENAIIVMEKRTTVTNDHYPAQYRVIRYIK